MKNSIIYADPPWTYNNYAYATTKSGSVAKRGVRKEYQTMSLDEICAMRPFIDEIAADDCLLAMWWVPPQPAEALKVVEAWGFTFKTMFGFSWRKTTKTGKQAFGMGNLTRQNDEACLFATRGKPKRVSASVRSSITAPIREHSRKPDEARDRLVQLMGDVPRIELFARQRHEGWEAWGLEA